MLALDQTDQPPEKSSLGAEIKVATLAVPVDNVEMLLVAINQGQIALSLRAPSETREAKPPIPVPPKPVLRIVEFGTAHEVQP